MIETINLIFTFISAFFAFGAAVFWFLSSKIKIPDLGDWNLATGAEPLQKAARRSSYAAISACISAAAQVVLLTLDYFN
jgi:hypothetical protein